MSEKPNAPNEPISNKSPSDTRVKLHDQEERWINEGGAGDEPPPERKPSDEKQKPAEKAPKKA